MTARARAWWVVASTAKVAAWSGVVVFALITSAAVAWAVGTA